MKWVCKGCYRVNHGNTKQCPTCGTVRPKDWKTNPEKVGYQLARKSH